MQAFVEGSIAAGDMARGAARGKAGRAAEGLVRVRRQ